MSLAIALSEGLTAAIIGMGIVFTVLILLAIILSFFKNLTPQTAKDELKTEVPVALGLINEEAAVEAGAQGNDNNELIVVISAAVATDSGGTARIMSITPVTASSTVNIGFKAWNTAARRENHRGLY